jgi:A118 family predicted phage portal protein
LQWIREWIGKMINTSSVKQALGVDVGLSTAMVNKLQLWALMYANQAPWLNEDVQSLNLPAAIAGEIARAVTIEMEVEVSGSPRAEYLEEQMEYVVPQLREKVEFGAAKGGLMLKPYVAGGRLAIDYVQADQFYPISYDANGCITGCVFSDQRKIGQYWYTRLEYHTFAGTTCEIKNAAFRSDSQTSLGIPVPLTSVAVWAELETEATIYNLEKPLFAYFRYPSANNIDTASPLGVSCYARAEDLIKQADQQWSDLLWEFESGKRALYVDELAFDRDSNKKPVLPLRRLYRTLKQAGQVGSKDDLFQEWTPTFREQNILNGLEAILKKVEFNCGLAYGTLSDPNVVAATATEIKMQKQRSFATITDTQKALQKALDDLLYAMDVWVTLANLAPMGAYEATYTFDDSIVADHDTQFLQDQQTVTMQAMPLYKFLVRNYGLSEADARQWVAEVKQDSMNNASMFGLPVGNNLPADNPADQSMSGDTNLPDNQMQEQPA